MSSRVIIYSCLLFVIGCGSGAPLFPGDSYNNQYGNYNRNPQYPSGNYYQERERQRLREERRELERERARLEKEREREHERRKRHAAKQQRKPESCPAGYRPGRCESKERKRGCKDMRLPGGLGCRSS